ncbi:AraC-like DNA-binding protein [Actinomycetospora succinea]|uniref:AraC-like DNA-binding protein n=1 Tax=Actinomycetospora succinea TaxID=663603 RepID=A0A4R6UMJ1_9PSEU|nr:helix-turn-helix domain-containing protein [Actinomycetospora succinea]TDQ46385.1 AraC-like DNA-binding protein [Actinomycetospora succinea]
MVVRIVGVAAAHARVIAFCASRSAGVKGGDMPGNHDPIDVALGVLMERYRQDVELASTMLVAMARDSDRGVRDFAETLVAGPREEHLSAASHTVRRAVSFIDANARSVIGIEEIAAAAHIGVRGLQQSFRKQRQQTPLGYLRQVRLEGARRDLSAGHRGNRVTVSDIASRWHFANTGRFAGEYRRVFGCSPSQTLHASNGPDVPDPRDVLDRAVDAVRRSESFQHRSIEVSIQALIATARAQRLPISTAVEERLHLLVAQELAADRSRGQSSVPPRTASGLRPC